MTTPSDVRELARVSVKALDDMGRHAEARLLEDSVATALSAERQRGRDSVCDDFNAGWKAFEAGEKKPERGVWPGEGWLAAQNVQRAEAAEARAELAEQRLHDRVNAAQVTLGKAEKRAEAAEAERNTTRTSCLILADQRDKLMGRVKEVEAGAGAMRSVLTDTADSLQAFPVDSQYGSVPTMRKEIVIALSSTAGRDMLARLQSAERQVIDLTAQLEASRAVSVAVAQAALAEQEPSDG